MIILNPEWERAEAAKLERQRRLEALAHKPVIRRAPNHVFPGRGPDAHEVYLHLKNLGHATLAVLREYEQRLAALEAWRREEDVNGWEGK